MRRQNMQDIADALQRQDDEQRMLAGKKPRKLRALPSLAAAIGAGMGVGPGLVGGAAIGGGIATAFDASAKNKAISTTAGAIGGAGLGAAIAAILCYKSTKELGYALSKGAVE